MSVVQWTLAFAFIIGALIAAQKTGAWQFLRPSGEPSHTATPENRQKTYATHAGLIKKLSDFDTGQFLLGMAVDLYNQKYASIAVLDDKAQKLIAFIGGGASLFALIAGVTGSIRSVLTPLLILSILCFLGSLLLCLLSLIPVEMNIPAISQFNSIPILADPKFRAVIARDLIDDWQRHAFDLTPILRKKGRYIFASSVFVAAGATLLLINLVANIATKPTLEAPNIHCSVSTMTSRWQKTTLTCDGQKA